MSKKIKTKLKRLCVLYKHANQWQGKRVEWMVCKACQREIANGWLVYLLSKAHRESLVCPRQVVQS